MAIRFQCGSCGQPIEIDDVWASKLVACPYCQKTVTAPAASTLPDLSSTPTATPLTGNQSGQDHAGDFAGGLQAPVRRSRLGIVALILASLALVMSLSFSSIVGAHLDQLLEMEHLKKQYIEEGSDMLSATQRAMAETLQAGPGGAPPMWVVIACLLMLGAGLTWFSAITCALIALRNPTSRRQASIALCLCVLVLILTCL